MIYRRGSRGSITVFISLIMLLVLAVVTTVIEMTRVTSAYTRATEISDISMDSCFSLYAKEIFEDYGIMLLWKNDEEFINTYKQYINKNCSGEDVISDYSDIYGLKSINANIVEQIGALDNGGEYMADQIYSYMKLSIAEDVADEILGKCESVSQGEDINEFYENMESCSDIMEDMEKNVEKIHESICTIQNVEELPLDILERMKIDLENIMNTEGDNEYSKEVRNNYFEIYKQDFRKYVRWEDTLTVELDNIVNETNSYLDNVHRTEQYVESMDRDLQGRKASLDGEIYSLMEGELTDIREEIINLNKDTYNVMGNQEISIKQKSIVENVKDSMSSIMEETRQLDYSYNKLSNYENGKKLIEDSYNCVCRALNEIKGYDCSGMMVNYEKAQGKKKKNEIVDFVKKIKSDGVLGYVTSGTLSGKKVSTDNMPSKTKSGDTKWNNKNISEEQLRKALVGQYIFDKFSTFVDNDDSGLLNYEVEYIIGGNKSDKENLEKVVNEIMVIREGFNLAFLMKDNVKRNEAYEAALAITGFTGMPVVVRITQFLILGAWAYAESVVDVKDLLSGYRVKLMKGENEWNLSLAGIKNLSSTDSEREKRAGLSYKEYLRVMLFTQNQSEQILRIMDMIEVNVQNQYNSNFKIQDCLVGITMDTEYELKRIFSTIGYAKDYIVYKDDKFIIKLRQSFKY